jgi:5-methylcytosine-specific restriction endonuclease McrA
MPRGVWERTEKHRQIQRDAWFASNKSKEHIVGALRDASMSPEAVAKRTASLRNMPIEKKLAMIEKCRVASTGREVPQERRDRIRKALTRLTLEDKKAKKRINRLLWNHLQRVLKPAMVRKNAKSEMLIGYTRQQLREHIEKQFRPGMSWEHGGFHVDHIKPISWFLRNGVFDPAKIHALENLQVLTPEENLSKAAKMDWKHI